MNGYQLDIKNSLLKYDNNTLKYQIETNKLIIKEIENDSNISRLIDMLVYIAYSKKIEIIQNSSLIDLSNYHFINNQLSLDNLIIRRLVKIGDGERGLKNNICDVEGVSVGEYSINTDELHTGLTVIKTNPNELFYNKVIASTYAFNGFGKSVGLMQVEEVGNIETPIVMTSTLNVGKVSDAVIEDILDDNPSIESINPVVLECNDGSLSHSQVRPMGIKEYKKALDNLDTDFKQGAIGAGSGMICHGLKGGIGSSSRIIDINGKKYTIGIIINSNFGTSNGEDLIFKGRSLGSGIEKYMADYFEKGSIVAVLSTDLPVNERQLKRMLKRVELGIGRTGSYAGNGSGDVFVGFSTKNIINTKDYNSSVERIFDADLNIVFKYLGHMVEEAVLNSMLFSHHLKGYHKEVKALSEFLPLFIDLLDIEIEYK